jgi:uncharacterized radical SAM superfamily Fe-S cluster-containing enzyme
MQLRLGRGVETALSKTASLLWPLVQRLNEKVEGPSAHPKWAPAPLLKRKERTFPTLGFPRETDSLCPACVKEARAAVLSGERDLSALVTDKPGEIRAKIVEEGGQVWMKKTCPKHGAIEDLMAVDSAFLKRIERLYPGRDYLAPLTALRDHGTSSIQYGRGSVLVVDLTNRCNMMCDPCFMDANQVGFVHELSWEDVTQILDDSIEVKPRRQMSIQFSGGEPTLSPHFLPAIRYAREKGYFAVQVATNGIRFAQDPEFAKQAKEAGLRMAYLQFDGIGNEANSHRKVGNLYDVKLRAIENLHAAGIDVILVVTVVNGVNNDQVGKIVQFAIDNSRQGHRGERSSPSASPGATRTLTTRRRTKQRYTLSALWSHDIKRPVWRHRADPRLVPALGHGALLGLDRHCSSGDNAEFGGSMNCGCHPNCGVGTILFVNKTHEADACRCTQFLDCRAAPPRTSTSHHRWQHAQGRARWWPSSWLALIQATYDPKRAPEGYDFPHAVEAVHERRPARAGKRSASSSPTPHEFEWRVLFVAGMWFQDLFNYDFRRTEMCIIPYGTQMGEISVLRVQHRRRLAQHRRADEGERDGGRVVQAARPP